MVSKDYRATARRALSGHWLTSILVALAAGLLGAGGNPFASAAGGSGSSSTTASGTSAQEAISQIQDIPPFMLYIAVAIFAMMAIYSLIVLIVGGAVNLGLVTYNIDLVSGRRQPVFSTLFSRFNIFGKAFVLNLLTSLFIALWTLLLVIPGFIAMFRYAMAPYLLAENPNLGAMDAIRLSKQIMDGNKFRLLKLRLSFIGWFLLICVTLGIAALWVTPYMHAAEAAFFLDVSKNNSQAFPQA